MLLGSGVMQNNLNNGNYVPLKKEDRKESFKVSKDEKK